MKEIFLTQGYSAIVDDSDYLKLKGLSWHFSTGGYAVTTVRKECSGKYLHVRMHRAIAEPPVGCVVDHINGNTFDNRRENLRICKHRDNCCNKKNSKNNTSGYKGVNWHKVHKKWVVRIGLNYKRVNLGYFKNKQDAAKAYNNAAIKYHREFASLNEF